MDLRFHWRLIQSGSSEGRLSADRVAAAAALPDAPAQIRFCQEAEKAGIDSVLVDINLGKPDPMILALALARATDRMTFMVAHRAGLMSPTFFVQQVNTFSALTAGRISLNMVAGHSPAELRSYGDELPHDERYERLSEYLNVCDRFWNTTDSVAFDGAYYQVPDATLRTPFVGEGRSRPEIYVGGSSQKAAHVAAKFADCWLRLADTPRRLKSELAPFLAEGRAVGLRLSIIARETREEALRAAHALLASAPTTQRKRNERRFVEATDSVSVRGVLRLADDEWPTPTLWTGAVRTLGATAVALVGNYQEVADAIIDFKQVGVSQFILLGWPGFEEMKRFGNFVLPLVRENE